MFSHHILRAMGQFPMPTYERLYIRWKQPLYESANEGYKQQFMVSFDRMRASLNPFLQPKRSLNVGSFCLL